MNNKQLKRLVMEFFDKVYEPGMIKYVVEELTALIDIKNCNQERLDQFVEELEELLDPGEPEPSREPKCIGQVQTADQIFNEIDKLFETK